MSPSAITERAEFANDAGHVIGVMTKRGKGEMKSLAVMPDDTVWLDEEEQIATANAPRSEEDNPFTNGHLRLVTEPKEIVNRRQIGFSDHKQVSDLEPEPTAPAEEESDPAGDSGSIGGNGSAGSSGAGDDDPPAPSKAPEDEKPAEQPKAPAGDKVQPPNLGGVQTPEQEAQAKAAAARAVAKSATPPKAATAPAKPAEGKLGSTEQVGTPGAQGK